VCAHGTEVVAARKVIIIFIFVVICAALPPVFVPTNIQPCENPKIPGNLPEFQEDNCPQNVILPPGDPPARLFPGTS